MKKMGLAGVLKCTSVVYEKRGAIQQRMCMKMHFFLSEGFVVPLLCHSDK